MIDPVAAWLTYYEAWAGRRVDGDDSHESDLEGVDLAHQAATLLRLATVEFVPGPLERQGSEAQGFTWSFVDPDPYDARNLSVTRRKVTVTPPE